MRQKFLWILLFLPLSLFAGCPPKGTPPGYWLVQKVHVKANATTNYESQVKTLVNQLQEDNQGMSPFNWFAFVSPDESVYTYVTPVDSLQHLQDIYNVMAKQSNQFSQLHQQISQEVLSWDVSLLMPLPKISYVPQASLENVQPYNVIENIQVVPGQEAAFENVMMNWAKNSKQINSASGWSVFMTLIGPSQPEYSIVYNGSSVRSFKNQFAEMAKLGDASQVKGFGILRGYSWSSNVYAPELSNVNVAFPRRSLPND